MDYHLPDSRWSIWGLNDFETYQKQLVVKGLFHNCVPKDVQDSYETAEHITAYAYYYYPLYDEAFSKLLRITEMAIFLKWISLGIKTENQKNKKVKNKAISQLIDELNTKEPSKHIDKQLHLLRDLRNSFMHPKNHSFSGSITNNGLKFGVVILNKLFLPEFILAQFLDQINLINQKILSFKSGLFVLEINFIRYLITGIEVKEAIRTKHNWYYYLIAFPVLQYITEDNSAKVYKEPIPIFINNISISDTQIIANTIDDNSNLQISSSTTDLDVILYKAYLNSEKSNSNKNDQNYFNIQNHIIENKRTEFLYKYINLAQIE